MPETTISNGSKQKGVELKEACFLHRKEDNTNTSREQFMLAGLNLKLAPGDFIGVMGTVGSGKSSLLQVDCIYSVYYGLSLFLILSYQLNFKLKAQALLGELEPAGGEALLWRPRRGVGYIAQEAWLQVHG